MGSKAGKLYLVATPLGNLEDITQRALRILNEVDFIAAEDTRHTLKLLNHFQIKKSLLSYYQHNERERSAEIITKIRNGEDAALVTDAGMPGISDPGHILIVEALQQEITVVPIPGATAVITALAASGLDTDSFRFEGFLPRKTREQTAKLHEMAGFKGTIVFYESPRRLAKTLNNILLVMGERRVVIARELTKIHEEFIRGRLSEVLNEIKTRELKGEVTVIVEGASFYVKNQQNSTNIDIKDLIEGIKVGKSSLRSELKEIAEKTGMTTREIYRLYLESKK